uniref:Ribosome production factor 2 homolog n=1 Tax=Kalanchoe fedtschenkoi TaxID=63787 RepID=A0A7N0TTQ0_KALFE
MHFWTARREVEKRVSKLVETRKKTLILHGTKTTKDLNQVLIEISYILKENCVRYTKNYPDITPFENGGETSLEFFSLKTDCSIFIFGSHAKKRKNNLVNRRTYDHQIYDLVEVGVENFKSMKGFKYDKKLSPRVGSKPFIAFIGEDFESVLELKHLKEVLVDLLRGEVVENLNLAGIDHAYICTATSANTVFFTHFPRMELVEVGPSMDFEVRRHLLPNESLRKEAMKIASDKPKKKVKNVGGDPLKGKISKIHVPDQQIGEMSLPDKSKGVKRERREAKRNNESAKKILKILNDKHYLTFKFMFKTQPKDATLFSLEDTVYHSC